MPMLGPLTNVTEEIEPTFGRLLRWYYGRACDTQLLVWLSATKLTRVSLLTYL